MPKFAANLSMLFTEVDFLDRFEKAAEAGFKYIEYLFPYDYEMTEIKALLNEYKLQQVLFNLPPGDWQSGERGIACLPDRVEEFRDGLEHAIDYAKMLEVSQLNCLSGLQSSEHDIAELMATLRANLSYAAERLAEENILLLVEAINSRVDMPGFVLDRSEKVLNLIREIANPNIKLQFDIYHMQIMQGDLLRSIEQDLDFIGHIQFADNPGRCEPGTGEINFPIIFEKLDQLGYAGWVSAEYKPSKSTALTLGWLQSFN